MPGEKGLRVRACVCEVWLLDVPPPGVSPQQTFGECPHNVFLYM